MTVHINSFPYLISPNDTLHLPFNLPDAPLGSILRMTNVSRIGVREYTLQGQPFVDPKVFTLKMRVVEHTKMPMVTTVKKKQRQRRARHLFNKQNYTVLKSVPEFSSPFNPFLPISPDLSVFLSFALLSLLVPFSFEIPLSSLHCPWDLLTGFCLGAYSRVCEMKVHDIDPLE